MYNKFKIIIFLYFISFLFIQNTLSKETTNFLTLKYDTVKVRQGPSFEYPVKFIYKKKNLPVKIVDDKENFKKVLDIKNNSGWIHISQLSKKKSAISNVKISIAFKKPSIYSQPLAKIEKGKLVNIKKCKDDWCKILLEKKRVWIQKKSLWGRF